MAIFIYFNILLRFLIFIFSIVFIGIKYISAYSDEYKTFTKGTGNVSYSDEDNTSIKDTGSNSDGDGDKTPTKDTGSDNVTPTEEINDITDMKNTVKNIEDILNGKVDKETLDEIKEEYSTWFEDEDNTEKEALESIKHYLDGEIKSTLKNFSGGLHKALDELNVTSDDKKDKTNETSISSPVDYVIDKQSLEPINPADDQD